MFCDLVRKCLTIDPRKRILARDAVNHVFFTAIRGFKKPTEPAFRIPAAKQSRVDLESLSGLSVAAGATSGGGSGGGREDERSRKPQDGRRDAAAPATGGGSGSGKYHDAKRGQADSDGGDSYGDGGEEEKKR